MEWVQLCLVTPTDCMINSGWQPQCSTLRFAWLTFNLVFPVQSVHLYVGGCFAHGIKGIPFMTEARACFSSAMAHTNVMQCSLRIRSKVCVTMFSALLLCAILTPTVVAYTASPPFKSIKAPKGMTMISFVSTVEELMFFCHTPHV